MRHQVTDRLAYGDETCCSHDQSGQLAVVHACKDPCHRAAVGYGGRKLSSSHPNYLVLRHGHHLFLNLIDPPVPLFQPQSFVAFFEFVDEQIAERPVLIHCNEGRSRAPSLALLYSAKRLGLFAHSDYLASAQAFAQQFPYAPGAGIAKWLATNWGAIL